MGVRFGLAREGAVTGDEVPVPKFGTAALADLTGSVLAGLGVAGETNVLGLPELPKACVLVIDGLGHELLREHADVAPFLASLAGRSLTAGFPATTATSLASLGTGRPPGSHGLFGYQIALPGEGRLINCLRWDAEVDPAGFQPAPTVYERAAAAGIGVSYVGAGQFAGSGLSRATARGAVYTPADSLGQVVAQAERVLRDSGRAYATLYHPDLDMNGHLHGAGSPSWRHQLGFVDELARRIAEVLPAGTAFHVTADHGMTNPAERLDVDETPSLREGVALLGGEARARHVYAEPGAADDVLAAWTAVLDGRGWVASREQAVEEGWFGAVDPALLPRIGDVLAVPYADLAIVATAAEPLESGLVGMHGSMVPAEQLVPLLTHTT